MVGAEETQLTIIVTVKPANASGKRPSGGQTGCASAAGWRGTCFFAQIPLYCGWLWDKVSRSGAPVSGVSALIGRCEQMFLGRYRHSLDKKGRLTIPARFRDLLREGAYLVQGFDRNLMVLTPPVFQQIYRRVNALSMTDPVARQLKRLIFSAASPVEVDSAGRILIPPYLREAVGLDGEAVIVGVGDYFEIWPPQDWEAQNALLQDAEANARRFAALDLSPGDDAPAQP